MRQRISDEIFTLNIFEVRRKFESRNLLFSTDFFSLQDWYRHQTNAIFQWLGERAEIGLHPYQLACLLLLVKVRTKSFLLARKRKRICFRSLTENSRQLRTARCSRERSQLTGLRQHHAKITRKSSVKDSNSSTSLDWVESSEKLIWREVHTDEGTFQGRATFSAGRECRSRWKEFVELLWTRSSVVRRLKRRLDLLERNILARQNLLIIRCRTSDSSNRTDRIGGAKEIKKTPDFFLFQFEETANAVKWKCSSAVTKAKSRENPRPCRCFVIGSVCLFSPVRIGWTRRRREKRLVECLKISKMEMQRFLLIEQPVDVDSCPRT